MTFGLRDWVFATYFIGVIILTIVASYCDWKGIKIPIFDPILEWCIEKHFVLTLIIFSLIVIIVMINFISVLPLWASYIAHIL